MRFLHLTSEFPPQKVYGLGRYVNELAHAQAENNHQVEVITNSYGGNDEVTQFNNLIIKRVSFPPPPKAPAVSAMLLHFNLQLTELKTSSPNDPKPDVIVSHDWLTVPAGFHLARILKCPLVTVLHDIIFNKVRGRSFDKEDEFIAGIENWACHISEKVIVLSACVRREVLSAYHADDSKVEVLPAGIGIIPILTKEWAELTQIRNSFCKPAETLLLFAGRFDPEKGTGTLLSACQILKHSGLTNWKLLMAGSGHLTKELEETVKSLGLREHILFPGYLEYERLRLAYAAADVVIVPSDYEPFGLVALEAQRMGTPVICSNTGGLSETAKITKGAVLFEPSNPKDLAAKIGELLGKPELIKKLSRYGMENVQEHYSWPHIAHKFSIICEELINKPLPAAITPPPWEHPKRETVLPDNIPDHSMKDWVLFWDSNNIPAAKSVIDCLLSIHPGQVLNSFIHVVPVLLSGDEFRIKEPIHHPRVKYRPPSELEDFDSLLKNCACVIAPGYLFKVISESKVFNPADIPVIILDDENKFEYEYGLRIANLEAFYFIVGKLTCDNRCRKLAAPHLQNSIPSSVWASPTRSRKKILHVVPQLVTGGAETTLLEIVKGLQGDFQHVILSLGDLEGPLPNEFRALGSPILEAKTYGLQNLIQMIQNEAPDCIHLHSMSYIPRWIPIHRLLQDVPILETEHVVNIGSGHFGPTQGVVAVSEAVKSPHMKFDSFWTSLRHEFNVIYNGLHPAFYVALPNKAEARKKLNLPIDRPIIGRVSALARNKCSIEAIEAVSHVIRAIPDALFVIVGDGPDRPALEEAVRQKKLENSVRFLGEHRDIPSILAAIDVFAYYTLRDALGNVILEALAAGCPVVTTKTEGTPEALGNGPGTLIELGDYNSFANAVKDWMNRVQNGWKSAYQLPERFTRAHMARAYSEVYTKLIPVSDEPQMVGSSPTTSSVELLIKFPTRGRPEQFFHTLDKYRELLSGQRSVHFVINADHDDATMNNDNVKSRLSRIPNLEIQYGNNCSKIEAINAGYLQLPTYRALLLASDDMIPQVKGLDDLILKRMSDYFPNNDGVLFFNDGYRRKDLNTLVVAGKNYLDRFGYIYNPEYKSLWCDNEFTVTAWALKKQVYLDEVIVKHEHPANTGSGWDPLYQQNDLHNGADHTVFERRKAQGFGLVGPKRILYILLGRLGDVLCGIPAFKALRQKFPGAHLGWATLPAYASLIPPIADAIIPWGEERDLFVPSIPEWAKEWDDVRIVQPSWHGDEWAQAKLPMAEFIARKAGVTLNDRKINLDITGDDRANATALVKLAEPFVIINAGPHHSGPNWPINIRQEVVNRLHQKGIRMLALAGNDGLPLEHTEPIYGQPFQTVVAVLEKACLYIGQDCGTSWLACCAHQTPKLILIDQSEGRKGRDSYAQPLQDPLIVELPLDSSVDAIVSHALQVLCIPNVV